MEIVSFTLLGAWLLKMSLEKRIVLYKTPLFLYLIAFIFLTLFQIIPLPYGFIEMISPSTNRIYKLFTADGNNMIRTISLYPRATINELLKLLSYATIFFVIIHHYRTKAQVSRVVRTIIYMGCFIAVFAVVQKMTWNGNLFWFYPAGEDVSSNLGYIWGPYINHNHFAGYMELTLPLGVGLLTYRAIDIKAPSSIPLFRKIIVLFDGKNIIPVVLLSLAVLGMTAVLFMSLSRGGIIGFGISMLLFMAMIRSRRSLRRINTALTVVGVIILFIVMITGWSRIEDRFQEIEKKTRIKRIEVWTDSIHIIRDFPVFGTGLGTFNNIYPHYQTGNPQFLFEHAENDYIEILTDSGVAGFVLIAGMVCTYLYSVIKRWRIRHDNYVKCIVAGGISSCMALAVHGLTDFNMRIPANAMLLTIIAAMTYSLVFHVSGRNNSNDLNSV